MEIYIRATGIISPQRTAGHASDLKNEMISSGNRLACVEPDYKEFIDAKLIRRMSRVVRMGVAAARISLSEAGLQQPDAIITGTAYGCLEDTAVFLGKMIDNNEEMLAPTAFIQSTHNTIGSQIGLLLQCHSYNNTFVHRGHSFESALLDSMLMLSEDSATHVLVGGIDEITEESHAILSRFDLYKNHPGAGLELFDEPSKGTIAGEGASFFVLSTERKDVNYAKVDAIETLCRTDHREEIEQFISAFLANRNLKSGDLDVLITGRNGDDHTDQLFTHVGNSLFRDVLQIPYKHLCGEYPTSSAFALWLAARTIKDGAIPYHSGKDFPVGGFKKILIYNHDLSLHHSLILLSAC